MYSYDRRAALSEKKRRFLDYDHALEWVAEKTKEYGGKNKFMSSPEYKEAYQEIDELYREVKKETSAKRVKQMEDHGLKYGDQVRYSQLALMFGGVVVLNGQLVERRGIPYVRLDQQTMGRREVRWHPGFEKA